MPITTSTNHSAILPGTVSLSSPGSWYNLGINDISTNPSGAFTVSFSLDVRAILNLNSGVPGDYGYILVKLVEEYPTGTFADIDHTTRMAILVNEAQAGAYIQQQTSFSFTLDIPITPSGSRIIHVYAGVFGATGGYSQAEIISDPAGYTVFSSVASYPQ